MISTNSHQAGNASRHHLMLVNITPDTSFSDGSSAATIPDATTAGFTKHHSEMQTEGHGMGELGFDFFHL